MARRARSALALAAGLALLAVGLARGDGAAGGPAPAAGGVRVKVEKVDRTTVEGTLGVTALRVETGYGTLDLAADRVRTIDFAADPGGVIAVIELDDHTRLRGKPLFDALPVVAPDGSVTRLAPADLREVKVVRTADTAVLALAVGLVTLTVMEIVLGIDNIIVLSIIVSRLPKGQQPNARRLGLGAALGTRVLLLFSLSFLLGLTKPIFQVPLGGLEPDVREVSWRDIILLLGGAFLIYKSVKEMHHKLDEARGKHAGTESDAPVRPASSFAGAIAQIAVIDIVFSLDSVITAVGMVDTLWVMVTAMVIAMLVMLLAAKSIGEFVDRHPTVKMLALSFLILIGVLLVAEALGQHISKGYIYFAMAFAVGMELVNMRLRPAPAAESPADA